MAKASVDRAAEMAALVAAVEHGGFSAAARVLRVTPSAMSKTLSRMETRLGVRLLNRTTRKLTLTPEGEAMFLRSRHILQEIDAAEQDIARARAAPRGLLRINSGVAFGLHQLPEALPEFLARYPDVQVELTVTDRLIDLVEEGADLAIRSGALPDSSLIARHIADTHRLICAAPAYLKKHGTPRTPDDLLAHNCLNIAQSPRLRLWPFRADATGGTTRSVTRGVHRDVAQGRRRDAGGVRVIEVNGNLTANNAESVLQMALMGVGIVRLGELLLSPHVRAGTLVPILTDVHHVEPLPLYAVYPHARLRSPKVGAMVDFLVEKFAHAPWRLDAPAQRGRARPARPARTRRPR